MTTPLFLVLAAVLAQADPGPAEPPPPSAPAPAPPGPAEAAPHETAGPAEPAPPESAAPGAPQSAPAAPTQPPPELGPTSPPRNTAALLGGIAYRLTSTALAPTMGVTIGGSYQRRYATVASVVELALAFEFSFDRFAAAVIGSAPGPNGTEQISPGTRTITSTNFAALQTLAVHQDSFRAWLGAGPGLSIGFISTPELDLRPGSGSAQQFLVRAAAGVDVGINKSQASVGLRAGYSFMLSSSALHTSNGPTFAFMGDLLDIQAGLFYRFR